MTPCGHMRLVNFGLEYGLSPVRHQTITWTKADLLPIGPLGTHFR